MCETPPTASYTEANDEEIRTITVQIITESKAGAYTTFVSNNFEGEYKDKIKALLYGYFEFFTFCLDDKIDINLVETLRIRHANIYTLLLSILKNFKNNIGLANNNKTEICQLLNNIDYTDMARFNEFVTIKLYQLMLSAQNRFIEQQEALQQEREAIVDRFEDVYLKSGISTYSKEFSNLCASENKAKKWWLGAMAACSVAFLVYFFANICILQQASDLTLTKLVVYLPVTALAFLILTWLGRRYAACREQEITYQHLTTILSTYKAFQENLDDTNKGLLILETARVVTAIPKPLAKESPSIDYSKVVDILKIMNKKE